MVVRNEAVQVAYEAIGLPLPAIAERVVNALVAHGYIVLDELKPCHWDYDPDTDTLTEMT